MSTAVKPATKLSSKKIKKPVRKPRAIGVIEDDVEDRGASSADREGHLFRVCVEKIKLTHYWETIEERATNSESLNALYEMLHEELTDLDWHDSRDGSTMKTHPFGVTYRARDGQEVSLTWAQLALEVEEFDCGANCVDAVPRSRSALPGYPKPHTPLLHPAATSTTTPAGIALAEDLKEEAREQRLEAGKKAKPQVPSPKPPASSPHANGSARNGDSILVSLIDPNPWQPRETFNAVELEQLASSIQDNGLLQPILVRPSPTHPGRYQIADGERRWRAVKFNGVIHSRTVINAQVRELTDRQMAELAIVANDERKDLSAIERARSYARMLKEFSLTHAQLAERLKRSPSFVANLVRLLDLPEAWAARVGVDLSPSHAELLLPFVKYERMSHALIKAFPADSVPPLKEFGDALRRAVRDATAPLDSTVYTMHGEVRIKYSPEQLEQLETVEVKDWDGKLKKRAINTTLAKQIVKEAKSKKAERQTKTTAASKQSPSEAKRQAEQQERKGQQARDDWRSDWLRYLIATILKSDQQLAEQIGLRLLLAEAIGEGIRGPTSDILVKQLGIPEYGCAMKCYQFAARADVWDLAIRAAPLLFWVDDAPAVARESWGREEAIDSEVVEAIAGELSIDLAAAWKRELAGPLTEAYFELLDLEELHELGKQCRVDVNVHCTDRALFTKYLSDHPFVKSKLPRGIKPVKPPKIKVAKPTKQKS